MTRVGVIVLVAGPALLLFSLVGYAISSFVLSALTESSPGGSILVVGHLMSITLGFIGILGILAVPLGAFVFVMGLLIEEQDLKPDPLKKN